MAERRMFAKTIIDSDAFLDMPMSARLLYYDLSMRADDEGFVNNPKKIMRFTGASQQDLQVLISNKFIIPFAEKGVVVIKHWFIHNYIRKDMFHETKYKEERARLAKDENNAYTLQPCNELVTECVTNPSTQVSIGQDRVRDSLKSVEDARTFIAPSAGDVERFCEESGIDIDAQAFIDYYSQSGWKVKNGNQMTNWKSAVRNWHRRQKEYEQKQQKEAKTTKFNDFKQRNYNYTELEQRLLGM